MTVTGLYMAHRIQYSVVPYVKAYGQCVLDDVEPAFSGLSEKANIIASVEFGRLVEKPVGENFDGDMSIAAESAQENGQAFYDIMVAIRQASLNLFVTGLFHLLEQQLADLCRDGSFHVSPPKDTKLDVVQKWYLDNFNLNLSELASWSKIEQLRLLANSVKHGEGGSLVKLRNIRPDIFRNPDLNELFPNDSDLCLVVDVRLPMAGEDIYVTTQIFDEFSKAVISFIAEIAEYFVSHKEVHYLVGECGGNGKS